VLKLPLTRQCAEAAADSGAFTVLLDPTASQTCYTDTTGTSRTAYATPEALLAFAIAIEQLRIAPASA
jgi:hypothetical protein